MKKAIVTGASGFLGKNLVLELLGKQVEVTAIVRNREKLSDISDRKLRVIELDMSEIFELETIIGDRSFDVFYHFAWQGTDGEDRENYEMQIENIKITCDAVKIAKILQCEKFIYAGSLMEYESMKFMGNSGLQPAGNYIYRSAKLAAHYIAKTEAGKLDIPFVHLIISNVYGKGEVSNRFISNTLQKICKGDELKFTSGTQLYDFIYITDATMAFYLVGKFGKPFVSYYVGSNQIKPLREYIFQIYESLSLKEKPNLGGVTYTGSGLVYDEFRRDTLEKETGFVCKVDFKDGILETFNWMKQGFDQRGLEKVPG